MTAECGPSNSHPDRLVNMIGRRLGRLVVVGSVVLDGRHRVWECVCDCGARITRRGSNLRRRGVQSCGCWNREYPNGVATGALAPCRKCGGRRRLWGKRWKCPSCHNASEKRQRAAHPVAYRERAKKYQIARPRWMRRVWDQRYDASHKEVMTVSVHRRNARKRQAPGRGVTAQDWRRVLADSLGLCVYCNSRQVLTLDHIVPLFKGGAHDPDNIVAACPSCNYQKKDRQLVVWLAERCGWRRLEMAGEGRRVGKRGKRADAARVSA